MNGGRRTGGGFIAGVGAAVVVVVVVVEGGLHPCAAVVMAEVVGGPLRGGIPGK